MPNPTFYPGMHVRARGERFIIVSIESLPIGERSQFKLRLRGVDGDRRNEEFPLLYPIETVEHDELPELKLDHPGRLPRLRLLHEALYLDIAPEPDVLLGSSRSRIRFELYQQVPALRAIELPRPRLLIADDVGLGKTIEAGILLRDLNARRRAKRVLIVCPAGIMDQWEGELRSKFGFQFSIFDSDGLYEKRRTLDIGVNPWTVEPRVITSMDYVKRREGAFRELAQSKWDVVIIDEAHHLAAGHDPDDITDRHRLGRWLAENTDALLLLTATPHDGYDENFISLLGLLEPALNTPGRRLRYADYGRYLIRRLKRHVNAMGRQVFVERAPVQAIPVQLNELELQLNNEVMSHARDLDQFAERLSRVEAESVRLVSTILRKRAASSRAALRATLINRIETLRGNVQEVELKRETLRAIKRGEAMPDDVLRQFEFDVSTNYLAAIRNAGRELRRAEDEVRKLESLLNLLDRCSENPESKLAGLLSYLTELHKQDSNKKVVVFTEYIDTLNEIASFLSETDYAEAFLTLCSDDSRAERTDKLKRFEGPDVKLLVATDVAGEGLNLQEHCHHLLHFDLPWNPNRLEQRNGRIDRYGQTQVPYIGFLYAKETFDGELLARLVSKIENQFRRLGSVGDVLGQLQQEKIEEILQNPGTDLRAAIEAADQKLDTLLASRRRTDLLDDVQAAESSEEDQRKVQSAIAKGEIGLVSLSDFIRRAANAAGGTVATEGNYLNVTTPRDWHQYQVLESYRHLAPPSELQTITNVTNGVLYDDHPLVDSAKRWLKSKRYDKNDDHRLAYQVADIVNPEMLVSFIITLRDGDGVEVQRFEFIRCVQNQATVLPARDAFEILYSESRANLQEVTLLTNMFGVWWQAARDTAKATADEEARKFRQAILAHRQVQNILLKDETDRWDAATRETILGDYHREFAQETLFGGRGGNIPPSIARKLREHNDKARDRRAFIERRATIEVSSVEEVGILLRVPLTVVHKGGAA